MAPPPSPLPAGTTAIPVLQFLNTALSQRGPSSLPYAEETKSLIRQHLLSLIEPYPSLHPQSSSFTHNNGRTVNLLNAGGTIPIVFGNAVYNIPASIWLIDRYPLSPPAVFLNPTPDMIVKSDHPHVDRSGCVCVPYIQNWVYPSSNLVDLVRSLSQIFSTDPPLFSHQNPNPNPSNPRIPIPSPPPSVSHSSSRIQGKPAEDSTEVFRRNAMNKIIEGWVRRNEANWPEEVDVDDAFQPADVLSRQFLECAPADLAVEDTVYSMEKAMREGLVPFEMYLKNVRALSREQFFHRALETKVQASGYNHGR